MNIEDTFKTNDNKCVTLVRNTNSGKEYYVLAGPTYVAGIFSDIHDVTKEEIELLRTREHTTNFVKTSNANEVFMQRIATIKASSVPYAETVSVACTCEDWKWRGVGHSLSRLRPSSDLKTNELYTWDFNIGKRTTTAQANNSTMVSGCRHMRYVNTKRLEHDIEIGVDDDEDDAGGDESGIASINGTLIQIGMKLINSDNQTRTVTSVTAHRFGIAHKAATQHPDKWSIAPDQNEYENVDNFKVGQRVRRKSDLSGRIHTVTNVGTANVRSRFGFDGGRSVQVPRMWILEIDDEEIDDDD